MTKKKILPSLLKINVVSLLFIFISVMVYNVYLALTIRNFDKVSSSIHDWADLTQYATTILLQKKSLAPGESPKEVYDSLSSFSKVVDDRLKERKESFLKVYTEVEYSIFLNYIKTLQDLENNVKKVKTEVLIEQVENAYIGILRFSQSHNKKVDEFFISKMSLLVMAFVMIIGLVLFVLIQRIRSIILPLRNITKASSELSISDGGNEFTLDSSYQYEEYQILANSLCDMHKRLHYENRMSSHESASESIGHFAENLAHSINNPLAIIATSVKILGKIAKRQANTMMYAETEQVLSEVSRITDITHQMKSLINTTSKSEPEYFKALNLITTINLLFFNRIFEKGIQIFYDKETELNLFGREDIIGQIVTILVENSIKYNDAKKPKIEIIFEDLDHEYIIHVRDNGTSPELDVILAKMKGDDGTKSLGLYTAYISALDNGYNLCYFPAPVKDFVLIIPKVSAEKKQVG